jgi:hypothetical protein
METKLEEMQRKLANSQRRIRVLQVGAMRPGLSAKTIEALHHLERAQRAIIRSRKRMLADYLKADAQ